MNTSAGLHAYTAWHRPRRYPKRSRTMKIRSTVTAGDGIGIDPNGGPPRRTLRALLPLGTRAGR